MFMFTSCSNKKELTPERARKIIVNWLGDENKHCQVNIVNIVRVGDYSQVAELHIENFTWTDRKGIQHLENNNKTTAYFLFEKEWKMVKFTIGDCRLSGCVTFENFSAVEESPKAMQLEAKAIWTKLVSFFKSSQPPKAMQYEAESEAVRAKARQSEAKTNLGAIYVAQLAFYSNYNRYGKTFKEINWEPAGQNLYSYFLSDEVINSKRGGPTWLPDGMESINYNPKKEFRAMAVGNIDSDNTLDVWTIDEKKVLVNLINDITE